MRFFIFLLLPFLLFASTDRALQLKKMRSESRWALVIGNSDYRSFSKLKNPVNDARAMKNALEKRGFRVIYAANSNKRSMVKAISKFGKKLRKGGVGLFFYAGHAIEVEGKNYLVPIGSKIEEKSDAEFEAIEANRVLAKMDNADNRLNIVILDACRNDPFSRGGGGGLVAINDAKGVFVAYATAPGKTASDGKGKHGLFTKHLLAQMRIPGNNLRDLFHGVRKNVSSETDGKQWPFVSDGTVGDFFFTLPDKSQGNQTQKVRVKETKQSSFSFEDAVDKEHSLSVITNPYGAKITITNIKKRFYQGMKLPTGKYRIKVSKTGFYDKIGSVTLNDDLSLTMKLKKRKIKSYQVDKSVIFDESFDNNKRSWLTKNTSVVKSEVKNGYYSIDHFHKTKGWISYKRLNGLYAGDDFIIEASIKHISGTKTSGYGLLWGDESKSTDYNFLLTGDGSYKFSRFKKGKWSSIIKWKKSGHIRKGEVNHLKIIKKGEQAKLYINGEYLNEVTVENFQKNYVGITVDRNQKVIYYGIKVTKK